MVRPLSPKKKQLPPKGQAGGLRSATLLSREIRARNLPALLNLGAAQAIAGDWSRSETTFREAIAAAPASAGAHAGLGRVLAQRGDRVAALAEYNIAIELKPDLAQAVNGRARVEGMVRH